MEALLKVVQYHSNTQVSADSWVVAAREVHRPRNEPGSPAWKECIGTLVILIIHTCWFLQVPYLTWLYFDWCTPELGSRRAQWIRSWAVWGYFKDYFPIHLIKTWDLDPSHNYIFGFHPHGVLVAGAFGNFCANHSDFKELFPGFTACFHMLPFWLCCPFFREYLMSIGK